MSILDFSNENQMLFDPGYSASVARVSGNIEYMYSAFLNIPSLKQKRFQFSVLYPKILKAIDLNAAFYLGCMLWGVYLKGNPDKEIVNNPCLNTEFNDDTFYEVDFLFDFIKEGFNRDAKYYLNKTFEINPLYLKILKLYKEFLSLNKGFINTEKTNDILLPESLKKPDEAGLKTIYETILKSVKEDNLEILFKISNIIV